MIEQTCIPFEQARTVVQDCDVYLVRGPGLAAKGIKVMTKSPYSHAGTIVIRHNIPVCHEINEIMGGRTVPLERLAARHSQKVDIYRPSPTHTTVAVDPVSGDMNISEWKLDRQKIIRIMKSLARRGQYGWYNLVAYAATHLPFVKWLVEYSMDDEALSKRAPHCSQAVSYAFRLGFTDLVLNTPDNLTSPGDLGRSPLLNYMFTLS